MSLRLLTLGVAIGACFYAYLNPELTGISSLNASEASLRLREFWHRTFFLSTSAPFIPKEQSHQKHHPVAVPATNDKLRPDEQRKLEKARAAKAAAANAYRVPSYFISSEEPEQLDNPHSGLYQSLQSVGQQIREAKPKAILVMSPYWDGEENRVYVNIGNDNPLIFDDATQHMRHLTFSSKASPDLAAHVMDTFKANKIKVSGRERGLDRGVWLPFRAMFGDSLDIPVIQIAQLDTGEPRLAVEVGQALKSLRDEGFMFIGTGMTVYSKKRAAKLAAQNPSGVPIKVERPTEAFDKQVRETMTDYSGENREIKSQQMCFAIDFRNAHFTPEKIFPLLFVVGSAGDDEGEVLYSKKDGAKAWGHFRFGNLVSQEM